MGRANRVHPTLVCSYKQHLLLYFLSQLIGGVAVLFNMDFEPPAKKPRLSAHDRNLTTKRARNNVRLKSRFDCIFEKYGRDFTDIADEIDFNTGEIAVDKGHLLSMRHERDICGGGELAGEAQVDESKAELSGPAFEKEVQIQIELLETSLADPEPPISSTIDEDDGESLSEEEMSERSSSPTQQSLWADALGNSEQRVGMCYHKWTPEEDDMLWRLLTTTRISYVEMERYFIGIPWGALRSRCKKLKYSDPPSWELEEDERQTRSHSAPADERIKSNASIDFSATRLRGDSEALDETDAAEISSETSNPPHRSRAASEPLPKSATDLDPPRPKILSRPQKPKPKHTCRYTPSVPLPNSAP